MQRSQDTSLGCFKVVPPDCSDHNSQESKNSGEGLPHLKNEMNAHTNGTVGSDSLLNEESSLPLGQGHCRPIYQKEAFTWPNFHPDVQFLQQRQPNSLENHFHPMNWAHTIPIENGIQRHPFKILSHGYPRGLQYQNFQYFLVIDFEATCEKEKKIYPQEIIEFPSVLVNGLTGEMEAVFQTYVRPSYHRILTDYCKELTGIQQHQVDGGVPLSEALLMHDVWLERKGVVKGSNFAVVTWGDWDCRVMLESECKLKRIIKPPYFNRWINLKVPFHQVFGGVSCDLKEAVQRAGLVWEGRHHSGIDDARNTAGLLSLLMRHGYCFSITKSLVTQDLPRTYPNQSQTLRGTTSDALQSQPCAGAEIGVHCLCGVTRSKCMVRKPGPTEGRWFFGCGNWTPARGAVCNYFVWASPATE